MDIAQIKRLRELTGVGITEAKNALVEANGDFDKALEAMRIKGLSRVDKKSEREARAGIVDSYVHSGRIGVIVEVNSETDFVARNQIFTDFVHEVALQIAATNAQYVSREDIPAAVIDKEKELILEEIKTKNVKEEIAKLQLSGRIEKFIADVVLLEQPFIKDPSMKFSEYAKSVAAKLGENIVIRRFNKIILGEVN